MIKTLEQHFIDWEADAFGFGYGTDERHTLSALQLFLKLMPVGQSYNFESMERELGPVVAWLLINALCKNHTLDYGTSPRHAWLTRGGMELRAFVAQHSVTQLVSMITMHNGDYVHCFRNLCQCDLANPKPKCVNPFWQS